MNKKIFQILSLISAILGLIFLILQRYGYTRFLGMHLYSTEHYISNYKNLEKMGKDRVIVSFTVNEDEMYNLKPFINSILDQTVRVDDIAVTIPYKNAKKIPKNLKNVLSIHGCDKDYDDAGNLICSVLREPEANTKIIMVEPYMIYGEDFIETMINESDKNPDSIIYGDPSKDKKYGILIKPIFFTDKISKYQKGKGCDAWLKECANAKDVVIDYKPIFTKL
jgi:hypothetical protein